MTTTSAEVIADVLPRLKVEIVKKFQALGKIIAMAGDWINDVPAPLTRFIQQSF